MVVLRREYDWCRRKVQGESILSGGGCEVPEFKAGEGVIG